MRVRKDGVSALQRKRRPRGKNGACRDTARCFVTRNGVRVEYALGRWGSPEAEKAYHAICAEFHAGVLLDVPAEDVMLEMLLSEFLAWAKARIDRRDYGHCVTAGQIAIHLYPGLEVRQMTGRKGLAYLEELQRVGQLQKRPWSRRYINKLLGAFKRFFRWGVSRDLVTPEVRDKVCSVPALEARDTLAPDLPPREDVPDWVVVATLPFLSQVVADMVKIQRGACMRPKELYTLRVGDLERTGSRWWCTPKNKVGRFGVQRHIAFSIEETTILRHRCVGKSDEDFVFSPRDAYLEKFDRITPEIWQKSRLRPPQFTADSYSHQVKNAQLRAIRAGISLPEPLWTPYQLRHAAVTETSYTHDREIASLQAGHLNLNTTKIYDHKAKKIIDDLARERAAWWE